MHAVLWTVLALSGAKGVAYNISDQGVTPANNVCAQCNDAGCKPIACGQLATPSWDAAGGCASQMRPSCETRCNRGEGSNVRQPAASGSYYRNERNAVSHPWHASLHDDSARFTYHVSDEYNPPSAAYGPIPAPAPAPEQAYQTASPQPLERADRISSQTQSRPVSHSPLRTLRR
jgi:hypothetical protein